MSPEPSWNPELDGPIAAPDHHVVLFENDEVRVLQTIVRAGDATPVHTHPKTVMYVVSGSHFVRRDASGNVLVDTRDEGPSFEMPSVVWSDGIPPHVIENPSEDDLIVIGVELKHQG